MDVEDFVTPRRHVRFGGKELGAAHDELALMDATSQAAAVKRGDVSARELIDAAIERVERLNPALNAVIHERFAPARVEADGFSDLDARLLVCRFSSRT